MSTTHRPLVIAHRGASADEPENTASAFRAAAEQGADWVELDVRLAADGSLIVNHDAWYRDERTVWSTPFDQVPPDTLDLAAALAACGDMGVNIEIKNSPGDLADGPWSLEVVDVTVELIGTLDAAARDRILVSSFDMATLDRIKDVRPTLATGYLVFDLNQQLDAAAVAADHGHDAFHPWDPFVTPELLEDCRSLGLRVNSWTVNEPERWSELVSWGVDGIITDTPGRLVSALA